MTDCCVVKVRSYIERYHVLGTAQNTVRSYIERYHVLGTAQNTVRSYIERYHVLGTAQNTVRSYIERYHVLGTAQNTVRSYIERYHVLGTAQNTVHFNPLADLFILTPTRFYLGSIQPRCNYCAKTIRSHSHHCISPGTHLYS